MLQKYYRDIKGLLIIEKRKKLEKEIARLEKLARSKRQPKKKPEILKRIKELEIIHNA